MNKKIKELYISGSSISEVAEILKMSCSGVKYILAKEGVTMRTRNEAVRIKHNKRLNSYSSTLPKIVPKELMSLYQIGLALYWGGRVQKRVTLSH